MFSQSFFSRHSTFVALVVVLVLVFAATVSAAAGDWRGPESTPPGDNILAPLNVGGVTQAKTGGLILGELGGLSGSGKFGLWVESGLVRFGNGLPTADDDPYRLTVDGNIRAIDASGVTKGKVYAREFCLQSASGDDCRSEWGASSIIGGGGGVGAGNENTLLRWDSTGNTVVGSQVKDDSSMVSARNTTASPTKPLLYIDRGATEQTFSATSPAQKKAAFYVRGGTSGYALNIEAGSANASALVVNGSGSVGIGTTNPGTNKLEVVGGPIKATDGLIVETRTSDPTDPEDGRIWLRTDL